VSATPTTTNQRERKKGERKKTEVKHQIKDKAKDKSDEEELKSTIDEYGISLDKEAIRVI
jgi:hypothetical protein